MAAAISKILGRLAPFAAMARAALARAFPLSPAPMSRSALVRHALKEGLGIAGAVIAAALLFSFALGPSEDSAARVVLRFDADPNGPHGEGETGAHGGTAVHGGADAGGHTALGELEPGAKKPYVVNARPAPEADGRPMVCILVTGLGLSEGRTREALRRLPPEVSLAFSPYARNLDAWATQARRKGHEFFIELPTEPFDFPSSDSGPLTLLIDATPADNKRRLGMSLSATTGFVGVVTSGRTRFATDEAAVGGLIADLAKFGLALVDDGTAPISKVARVARAADAPFIAIDRRLDVRPTEDGIALKLVELERIAVETGRGCAASEPYPVAVERIAAWSATLAGKGLVLAPISAQIPTESVPGTGAPKSGEKKPRESHAHGH